MTTTSVNLPFAEQESDALGKMLYLEFRRDDGNTTQYCMVQEMVDPMTGKIVPFTVMSRMIDAEHPQRMWKIRSHPEPKDRRLSQGQIEQTDSEEKALSIALENLAPINMYINSLPAGEWKLLKDPLVVEINDVEVSQIANGSTPASLFRRLGRVRKVAGFPDELYDGDITSTL